MFKNKALKYQQLTLLWIVVVLVLCNMKMSDQKEAGFFFEGFDKMTHLGLFYILTVFYLLGSVKAHQSYHLPIINLIGLFIFSAALGGGIELLQWKVFTYRSAEWWDFSCDLIGNLMAIVSYLMIHYKEYKREKV